MIGVVIVLQGVLCSKLLARAFRVVVLSMNESLGMSGSVKHAAGVVAELRTR